MIVGMNSGMISGVISVWRLSKAEKIEKAFDGEGARVFGGRWNHKGTPVIYTGASASLCVLEILVHVDSDLLPNFYLYRVDIPLNLQILELKQVLPKSWRQTPAPEELQSMGTQWVNSSETAVLRVPSAIVPFEFNYLINPLHADFRKLTIGEPTPFDFDPRLRGNPSAPI